MNDRTPTFGCGHPRTPANTAQSPTTRPNCKTCATARRRDARRRDAIQRCADRGHARVEYVNARGWICCAVCEADAGRRNRERRADLQRQRPGSPRP